MSLHSQHFYSFDGFTIDTEQRVLLRSGYRVQLTPKALDILLALVQRSGQVVDKETLMNEVWPDTYVEDINLAYNIHVLRKVLGATNGSKGDYIETIPKRGYRFVQSVTEVQGNSNHASHETGESPGRAVMGTHKIPGALSSFQKRLGFLAVLVLCVVTTVLIVFGYSNRLKQIETGARVESSLASPPPATSDFESRARDILKCLSRRSSRM
jgi:DNA-binding winged helix-turn-helix (wHTH) protein